MGNKRRGFTAEYEYEKKDIDRQLTMNHVKAITTTWKAVHIELRRAPVLFPQGLGSVTQAPLN